nr:hypothetical protein [Arthrobacter sp. ISL-72]
MGNENAWLTHARPTWNKSGRKGDDLGEKVSVGQAKAQGVGGAIGKATACDTLRIHGDQFEHTLQGAVY